MGKHLEGSGFVATQTSLMKYTGTGHLTPLQKYVSREELAKNKLIYRSHC